MSENIERPIPSCPPGFRFFQVALDQSSFTSAEREHVLSCERCLHLSLQAFEAVELREVYQANLRAAEVSLADRTGPEIMVPEFTVVSQPVIIFFQLQPKSRVGVQGRRGMPETPVGLPPVSREFYLQTKDVQDEDPNAFRLPQEVVERCYVSPPGQEMESLSLHLSLSLEPLEAASQTGLYQAYLEVTPAPNKQLMNIALHSHTGKVLATFTIDVPQTDEVYVRTRRSRPGPQLSSEMLDKETELGVSFPVVIGSAIK